MPRPDVDPTPRFRELVQWMLEGDGRHGARKRIAERLGLFPSDISKIVAGKRPVGWKLAERAAKRIDLPLDYFASDASPNEWFYNLAMLDRAPLRGSNLGTLRTRAIAIIERFGAAPRFGALPADVRQAGQRLAHEVTESALVRDAREVLALKPSTAPAEFDRAVFDLAIDINNDVRDPHPPVHDAAVLVPLLELMRSGKRTVPGDVDALAKALAKVLAFVTS